MNSFWHEVVIAIINDWGIPSTPEDMEKIFERADLIVSTKDDYLQKQREEISGKSPISGSSRNKDVGYTPTPYRSPGRAS